MYRPFSAPASAATCSVSAPPPLLSVGLPVFNGERYLAEAIDCVLAQTFADFELIISDNASTDATASICADYAAKDARVRYSRNARNLGAALNFNRVVELARGRYFKWQAADDRIEPDFLDRCVAALDRSPAAVLAYTRSREIDKDGHVFEDQLDRPWRNLVWPDAAAGRLRILIDDPPWPPRLIFGVIRTKALRATRLLGSYFASDLNLLVELGAEGSFVEVPEFLQAIRVHSGASTWPDWTLAERVRFYIPDDKGGFSRWLTLHRHRPEYIRSILRARHLSPSAKVSLIAWGLRQLLGSRFKPANETRG